MKIRVDLVRLNLEILRLKKLTSASRHPFKGTFSSKGQFTDELQNIYNSVCQIEKLTDDLFVLTQKALINTRFGYIKADKQALQKINMSSVFTGGFDVPEAHERVGEDDLLTKVDI